MATNRRPRAMRRRAARGDRPTFDHRQVRRGVYVIRRDGDEVAQISLSGLERESLTVLRVVEAIADVQLGGPPDAA